MAEAAAPVRGGAESKPFFEPADAFDGARPGFVFKMGHLGLGYYVDAAAEKADCQLDELRPRLPERWRRCTSLRQERLRVHATSGAGLSLEHSEFGFAIAGVDETPGQSVCDGEVIVAMEGRLLAGLSAPQMQASFQKRRIDGARLQVASLEEVKRLNSMEPGVVECWDAQHQRVYYFHKKTGKSGWTLEDVQQPEAASSSSGGQAPIDIANFLSHGFAKPKELPKPKKRKVDPQKAAEAGKEELDFARDERKRWSDWNAGERGGYTEQFLDKYKNCQSNPAKPKKDKRLQGSVGPGQGMEYMARWTGSNNSFN